MFGELRPVDGGMPILLEKPSITLGQDRASDVVITHPSVSATHCHMEFRDGYWFIEDLGSRDGVFVNGERVERAWVPALSVLNIGAVEYDLEYASQTSGPHARATVTTEQLTKLNRVLNSVQSFKNRRVQIQIDRPIPDDVPGPKLGTLQPVDGGSEIPLLYDELYLGRDSDNDIILPYLSVARTHCVLRFQEGYWLVRDLNQNGLTIDGKPTIEGWLLPGAVLSLAKREFTVSYSTTADLPPPEMAVPLNEFDFSDDRRRTDDDSDVVELDESVLIDSDDELEVIDVGRPSFDAPQEPIKSIVAFQTTQTPVSEASQTEPVAPLVAVQTNLQGDTMLVSLENTEPPGARLDAVEPPIAESNPASAPIPNPLPTESANRVATSNRKHVLRKSRTASAKPSVASLTPTSTLASSKSALSSPDFVELRRGQILSVLKARNVEALLLTQPGNIAWYTGGIEPTRSLSGQATVALLLTGERATLLGRPADVEVMIGSADQLIGLQHQACDWPEGSQALPAELKQSQRFACDRPTEFGIDASPDMATLRPSLSAVEIETLRKLGIRVTRAIEKAAREFQRGDTEAQIAGDIASRLVRHEVVPERIQVWGDGRGQSCPNWTFRRDAVEHFCTISVIARRQGLHVAVSRTVSFGTPPKELRWTYSDMLQTHMTAVRAIRDQEPAATVIDRVQAACGTLGFVPDWSTTAPGAVTGYQPCETPLTSSSSLRLQAGMPLIWQSSLGPARAIDTLFVRKNDGKVVTQTGEWPLTSMTIAGRSLFGQAILQRSV